MQRGPVQIKSINITQKDIFISGKPILASYTFSRSGSKSKNCIVKRTIYNIHTKTVLNSLIKEKEQENLCLSVKTQKSSQQKFCNERRMLFETRSSGFKQLRKRKQKIDVVTKSNFRAHNLRLDQRKLSGQMSINDDEKRESINPERFKSLKKSTSFQINKTTLSSQKAKLYKKRNNICKLSTCSSIKGFAKNVQQVLQSQEEELHNTTSSVPYNPSRMAISYEKQPLSPWKMIRLDCLNK